uniref:AD domain-containing protein n=1 Tax=Rhabditophanes sp. KR3021 TaxID=114890 RepID=A0AC35UA93_9BILA
MVTTIPVAPTTTTVVSQVGTNNCRDIFEAGCLIKMEDTKQEEIVGQILTFHQNLGLMVLFSEGTGGGKSLIRFLNMRYFTNIRVVKEAPPNFKPPFSNCQPSEILTRLENEKRKKSQMSLKEPISLDGQKAFLAIFQTIERIRWEGKDIVVMESVRIREPYSPASVELISGDSLDSVVNRRTLEQISKILEQKESIASRVIAATGNKQIK